MGEKRVRTTDVKRRMKVKAQKIQRYTNRNNGYQNKLF